MDNKFKSLITNTKVFAIGNIVAKLSQYLIIALCSYRLTTSEFGISETIIQTCAMLVPIFSADIAEGLFRFSMDKNYSREQVISNSMVINLCGTLIAIIAFPVECMLLKDTKIAVFITILTLLELYQVSVKEFVRGLGLTKVYMVSGFANALTQISSCLIYVYVLNLGIIGYILTIATAYFIEILFCLWRVNILKYLKTKSISKIIITDLLRYSVPLAPNKIMWWIISASDRYFILWLIGASDTGLYSMAAKFPALITIVVSFFFQAWQISAIQTSDNSERDVFYSKVFNLLWSSIGIMTAFVIVFIRLAVRVFVADEYFVSWEYAPFLLAAASFSAIQSFLGVNYTIAKDSIGTLKSTTIAAICNLALNYILIRTIGIQGATIATFISYVIVSIYRYLDTRKYVTIIIDNKIGMIVTYLTILIECIVLALFPELYLITIPCFLIILFANRKVCVDGIRHMKTIYFRRHV